MADWAESLIEKTLDRMENGADAIGLDAVAFVREKISVPVQYIEIGDSVHVERSLPGDYPRKEFGHLWESERHEVDRQGTTVRLRIINDAEYAGALHDGHDNVAPRPFHDLAMVELVPELPSKMAEHLGG